LNGQPITICVLKYDGTEHRRWSGALSRREGSLIVVDAHFEHEVSHELLGTIVRGTCSREYYWLDRWYNIFRFAKPDGELRNYYCNINLPPSFDGKTLRYVDLDVDIVVQRDLSYRIVDLDEFAANAARFSYPEEIQHHATAALTELVGLIEACSFPFEYQA
jgi:uncharacterized protein